MAGSSAEETLEAGLRAARKLSMDGTRAIYDLTSGVDFSKPRRTAEAIARVVWEQDVESWWTWEGTEPVFKPNRTVEIRLPRDPDRKVAKAAAEFQTDLKEEFAPSIDSYLYRLNDDRAEWFSILDRKSTRLNSSHLVISYAVFCLKKKKKYMKYESPDAYSFRIPLCLLHQVDLSSSRQCRFLSRRVSACDGAQTQARASPAPVCII